MCRRTFDPGARFAGTWVSRHTHTFVACDLADNYIPAAHQKSPDVVSHLLRHGPRDYLYFVIILAIDIQWTGDQEK